MSELPVRDVKDPRVLRAMAHPLRLRILEAVAFSGPATATEVAELVGESPSAYRARSHDEGAAIPACVAKIYTRPVRNGEAKAARRP